MKIVKLSAKKSVEEVCKEIEKMIHCVLGTKPYKTKEKKSVVYYPKRGLYGTYDIIDDVKIVVRKVNNSLTSVKMENSEQLKNPNPFSKCGYGYDFILSSVERRHKALEKALSEMFPKDD